MKLFERHGGYWLFWTGAIYLTVAFTCAVWYKDISTSLIQLVWILVMSLPLYFPPLGRWLNLDIEWDRKMFDWFGKKEYPKYMPEGLGVPRYKETVEEKAKEPKAQTMYSIGLTDNNRVSLKMGYSEITMNPLGVQNLIDQLELFKKQIIENDTTND